MSYFRHPTSLLFSDKGDGEVTEYDAELLIRWKAILEKLSETADEREKETEEEEEEATASQQSQRSSMAPASQVLDHNALSGGECFAALERCFRRI